MIGYYKQYFIKARYVENIDCWWFQLIDEQGTRPGPTTATETTPARVYSKRYNSLKVGGRNFTQYRAELERRVN